MCSCLCWLVSWYLHSWICYSPYASFWLDSHLSLLFYLLSHLLSPHLILDNKTNHAATILAILPPTLTTAAVNGRFQLSSIGFTTSLSSLLEAPYMSLFTPSMSIIAACLIELELKKDCWQRIACNWYAQVSQNSLAMVSCPIIWDLVTRQKVRSYVWFTTLSRGKQLVLIAMNFSSALSMIATHTFETAHGSIPL